MSVSLDALFTAKSDSGLYKLVQILAVPESFREILVTIGAEILQAVGFAPVSESAVATEQLVTAAAGYYSGDRNRIEQRFDRF